MREQIFDALGKLDPLNEQHWTAQGLPKVEIVVELSGLADLKRKDISDVAPDFTRESVSVSLDAGTERERLEGELAELNTEIQSLQSRAHLIQTQLDSLILEEKPQTTTDAIKSYIKRGQQTKAEEIERRRELEKMGVRPREIRPSVSPIDARLGMRRQTDRPRITA